MHETREDLERLQSLLDRTYASAGEHLLEIVTPERRFDAPTLAAALDGMRLLVLATVTQDGRPIAGPVDGFFYRGDFYFGSSPESVRFKHLRKRPAVSATHLPGEEFAVTVHGRAAEIDVADPSQSGFRSALLDYYVPRYGAEWEDFLNAGPTYARIDADRLYSFSMVE